MRMPDFEQYEEKSVFVSGFAEAASEKAKQGKAFYMIFFIKRRKIIKYSA